VGINLR